MITVKELIEELKKVDENLPVILQRDSEGNGYSPLAGCDTTLPLYVPTRRSCGEIYSEEDIHQRGLEANKDGCSYDLQEDLPGGIRCVVLWPIQ